ncbi:MAG: ribosome silencing factor [Burkholderiales bacterium]|nr:MAG: ribosome silencing factor [Burkholderiales bacterium]
MTSESTSKKQLQRLQRAIVDGLEDVKGQDIVVFNTEELSPLFERVIVASGTSNRQTKALAASVRDKVREAGFDKPRIEGEDNGEWIIVDCGQAVAHVMQPVIRQYYRLEEIWGAKPVRLRHGAAKDKAASGAAPRQAGARTGSGSSARTASAATGAAPRAARPSSGSAAAKKTAGRKTAPRTGGGAAAAEPSKPARRVAAPRSKAPVAKLVVNKPRPAAKAAAGKSPARKTAAKKKPS